MKAGDEKTITVSADEAYGPVNENAFQEVPKSMFPADFEIKVGLVVPLQDDEGRTLAAVIQEIKEESVLLNLNHPLAGKDLTFAVKIIDVQ